MTQRKFFHPEPAASYPPVHPIFIPFAGCKARCVFCSQENQSGTSCKDDRALADGVLAQIALLASGGKPRLKEPPQAPPKAPVELAFYGGTFTALPFKDIEAFLLAANTLKEQGMLGALRCSTRPDALSMEMLQKLKHLGMNTIELGVQSFCDKPLAESKRGYAAETAIQACHMVQEAGLTLGIQLMPGMPGMQREHFLEDIERCAGIKPAFVRLYPCLVLEGTALAGLWRQKLFTPWSLDTILELLPDALLTLWNNSIKVIRIGLAPQKGLQEQILDGPRHPALGQILRSLALFKLISAQVREFSAENNAENCPEQPGYRLYAPKRFQGEFYGHAGSLTKAYAGLKLSPPTVCWWDKNYFELR
jgi:histone acetyltransferase (RNA polymerase elongator complex component)